MFKKIVKYKVKSSFCKICDKKFLARYYYNIGYVQTCNYSCKLKLAWKNLKNIKQRNINASLAKLSEKNPMWKGKNVGYGGLHDWIKRRLKKPLYCALCNKKSIKLDLANISQKYKRDLSDWEWLCRKCHMEKDGRLNNFIKMGKARKMKDVI